MSKTFRRWHRILGISASLILLVIALTGLLLNHSTDFSFDKCQLRQPWIMALYGIDAPPEGAAFKIGNAWALQMGNRIFVNDTVVRELAHSEELIGALSSDDFHLLATKDRLYLYTSQWEFIEGVGALEGVPTPIDALGREGKSDFSITSAGERFRGTQEFSEWKKDEGKDESIWSVKAVPPRALVESVVIQSMEGPTLERFLIDIHSMRLPGTYGFLMNDSVGVILIVLIISGLVVSFKTRKRGN